MARIDEIRIDRLLHHAAELIALYEGHEWLCYDERLVAAEFCRRHWAATTTLVVAQLPFPFEPDFDERARRLGTLACGPLWPLSRLGAGERVLVLRYVQGEALYRALYALRDAGLVQEDRTVSPPRFSLPGG